MLAKTSPLLVVEGSKMNVEITLQKFRELCRNPGSEVVREQSLDGQYRCLVFRAGKKIAESVTSWICGHKQVKYF